MKNTKVISLDMFQTLVNVDSRLEQIWRPVLLESYTAERAEEYGQGLLKHFFAHWNELKRSEQFYLMREIYQRCMNTFYSEKSIHNDISIAVDLMISEHPQSHFYDESVGFLQSIVDKYHVCIVSDADNDMIPLFYKDYGIHLFTSESYQSYKNDDQNTMFKEIITFYGVDPDEILHIGDSASDVLGASREGIVTCWINRHNRSWTHEVKPEFEVRSLDGVGRILCATIRTGTE